MAKRSETPKMLIHYIKTARTYAERINLAWFDMMTEDEWEEVEKLKETIERLLEFRKLKSDD